MRAYFRGVLIFYQSFAPFTLLISVSSWVLLGAPLGREFMRFFPLYVFLEAFTGALIWYYIKSFSPNTLFFYFNLGISELRLFLSAFALDMLIFLLIVFVLSIVNL